jgi:putative ABC transport system substrate-binding protein
VKRFWILQLRSGQDLDFGFSIERSQSKKVFCLALCAILLALNFPAQAQPKKVPRIGWLGADPQAPTRETFLQGLRDLGYVEGQSILVEWRFAKNKPNQFPDLAAELVRLKLDAIVASNAAVVALKRATTTIPIVMATYGGDPVADGIVASFAKPGGNITGLTPLDPELIGKQLKLLKETLPKRFQVAVIWKPDDSGSALRWRETRTSATALGIQRLSLEVRTPGELDNAIERATRARVDGLLVLRNPLFYVLRKRMITLAEEGRLPVMYPIGDFVEVGGLMSYSGNNDAQYRRAATFVDKILKGTKPANLPPGGAHGV